MSAIVAQIDITDTTAALQYGALGLLFLVLIGLFILARTFLDRMFEQNQADREFAQEQVTTANIERKAHVERWADTVASVVAANTTTSEALGRILENLMLIKAQHEQVLDLLKKANGGEREREKK